MLKTIWKFANSLRSDSASFQINAKSRPLSFSKPPANGPHSSVIPAVGLMMIPRESLDLPVGQIGVRLLRKNGREKQEWGGL